MQKTMIVSGAAGNLGQALVKKFLEEGFKVIGTLSLGDTAAEDNSIENFEKISVDLLDEEATQKVVRSVITKYKIIDAAVLTVGGYAAGKFTETKSADILKQYRLNFETAWNLARPLFIQMLEQGYGRIFLVGSRPGLSAKDAKGMVAYAFSKSLIFRLAEMMNEEAKGTNVVTSVLISGTIDTDQNRKSMPDADFSKWVTTDAIAGVVYFYCTDTAAALREPVIKF